mmetsp:Transcript_88748/g.160006  ORF Transcript_88748/g.160006 Transcript_88748/m.160006 type:complete len:245 (+) Transcript_88748:279-1013(+)
MHLHDQQLPCLLECCNRIRAAALVWIAARQGCLQDGRRSSEGRFSKLALTGSRQEPLLEEAAGGYRAQSHGPAPGAATCAHGLARATLPGGRQGKPAAAVRVLAALPLQRAAAQPKAAFAAHQTVRASTASVLTIDVNTVGVLSPRSVGCQTPMRDHTSIVHLPRRLPTEESHVAQCIPSVAILDFVRLFRTSDPVEVQCRHLRTPRVAAWRRGIIGGTGRGLCKRLVAESSDSHILQAHAGFS